jgi:hypothetical protein
LQRYVAGAICWSDYQKLINNLHRQVQILSTPPDNELVADRVLRRARGHEYKKALRIHQEHIRLGAHQQIAEAGQALEVAGLTDGVTERELQMLRSRLTFLEQYGKGIQPTNIDIFEYTDGAGQKEKFYAQLGDDARLVFLEELWNENVLVSFM